MALTILITSSTSTLPSAQLITRLSAIEQQHKIIQIFFLAEGLSHTVDNAVISYLSNLKATAQPSQSSIAIGYCPSSAERHIPGYSSDILDDYGLTQFYALIHDSDTLEQL